MAIRRDWVLEYDVDDILRSQSADPAAIRARRPKLIELSQHALDEGRTLIDSVVLIKRIPVEKSRHNRITLAGGHHLSGPLITEHLGGADEIVVLLCTIGDRLGKRSVAECERNLSYGFALDAVGSAAVQSLNAAACNVIEQEAISAGLQTSLPLSPGMEGWGVDPGQRELFELIEADKVGVALSETLEMRPLKSLSAVIGVGTNIATKGAICDYCGLRDTCRQRIA
ncbi:MAG: hypothetical protein M5U23_01035 [Acidimicrobiia bacterium]|nr:hypothetical protein [Acidimicrobiia bacterium]